MVVDKRETTLHGDQYAKMVQRAVVSAGYRNTFLLVEIIPYSFPIHAV